MAEARRATLILLPSDFKLPQKDRKFETLRVFYETFMKRCNQKIYHIRSRFQNGLYPSKPGNSIYIIGAVFTSSVFGVDPSFGLIEKGELLLQKYLQLNPPRDHLVAAFGFSMGLWITLSYSRRILLRALLTYHGWMYENFGRIGWQTRIWFILMKMIKFNSEPKLYSFQNSIPSQPLPKLKDTIKRYLRSIKPLTTVKEYQQVENMAYQFQKKFGNRIQFFLYIKYLVSPNYISDWWEKYVYLASRAPLVVNSNYYGMDAIFLTHHWRQPARAANLVCAAFQVMNLIKREEFGPIILQNVIPLCSSQYDRMFGTTRIPRFVQNSKGGDELCHVQNSNHIVVIHKGRFFKCLLKVKNRKLQPVDMEEILQSILNNTDKADTNEEHIPCLTGGERNHWALVREKFFNSGVNKSSLDCVESAAFILILEETSGEFRLEDEKGINDTAHALIHGKGYDRWFDKSFNLVVFANGRAGFNAEHSCFFGLKTQLEMTEILCDHCITRADAPIIGHMWEYILLEDVLSRAYGYTPDGHCRGIPDIYVPPAERLKWEINNQLVDSINLSMEIVNEIIRDLDIHIFVHSLYGKGFMKKCKVSPDGYIQIALQLTYYRMNGEPCLTYESSMARLFRDGRTETVRSCSSELCEAIQAIDNEKIPISTKILYFRKAADYHQELYRDAMTGKGIDRHLFCMYVTCKFLNIDSPFLMKVLSQPWKLSTSQTPFGQTKQLDLRRYPNFVSAGGGFGPVADDGYGVSYIIAGEDRVFFHISSKYSCKATDSKKFAAALLQSLKDVKEMFMKE